MKTKHFFSLALILMQGFLGPLNGKDNSRSELDTTTFPVILEPIERTEFFPEINAPIETINVKMGDRFDVGDLLLMMENTVYHAQIKKTEKAIEKAKEDLYVKKALFGDGLISRLELLSAEADLATAEAEFQVAERNLTSTLVAAPYSGKVAAVHARPFEMPPKEKPMIEILNDKMLLAKFIMPATFLNRLERGNSVFILIKDLDLILPGTIARVGAEINPVSFTINVEAEIDNSLGKLTSGMPSVIAFNRSALLTSPDETLETILKELSREQ